jgi:hypothetical protein
MGKSCSSEEKPKPPSVKQPQEKAPEASTKAAPQNPDVAVAATEPAVVEDVAVTILKSPSEWTETEKADKATVLAAVKVNGYDVQWASDDLKDDFDIGMAAVKERPQSFGSLGPKVRRHVSLS